VYSRVQIFKSIFEEKGAHWNASGQCSSYAEKKKVKEASQIYQRGWFGESEGSEDSLKELFCKLLPWSVLLLGGPFFIVCKPDILLIVKRGSGCGRDLVQMAGFDSPGRESIREKNRRERTSI